MKRVTLEIILVILALSLLVAGCGDNGTSSIPPCPSATTCPSPTVCLTPTICPSPCPTCPPFITWVLPSPCPSPTICPLCPICPPPTSAYCSPDCRCYSYEYDSYRRCVDATAICNDETCSFSTTISGTCSWHGGVKEWIYCP